MNATTNRATGIDAYDPEEPGLQPFTHLVPALLEGSDTPRDYLERCIQAIEAREDQVMAFVHLNLDAARSAANAARARYKDGRPLSSIDGMPIAVKDIIETEDMPTEHGSALSEGHQSLWDAACVYWLRRGGGIIIGKTVTTEFAARPPGPPRNTGLGENTVRGARDIRRDARKAVRERHYHYRAGRRRRRGCAENHVR